MLALVAAPVGFAVVNTAYGWLYLIGPGSGIPGPRLSDALPLDELPRHAAVPVLAFACVWTVAAVLLGLLARLMRLERPSAAVLLALAVGSWAYLETAVSILTVRQIPTADAFRAATELPAVYIPAVVGGLAGALIGRARPPARPRGSIIVA